MTRTMRVAVLYDIDDIRVEDRAIPELHDGEVLVKTEASGICSGDVMPWYIRRKAPVVFGHEPAGTVVEVRGRVPFAAGERVFVHHHAPCFACRACDRGDHVQCPSWRASAIDPGAMAEYFRVPAINLGDTLRVPQTLDAVAASLVEPLACVVKSLRRAQPRDGDTIYVIGLGIMGLMHVALARARGFVSVASDFSVDRRERAEALGAATFDAAGNPLHALHERTDGRGAELVICGPGSAAALAHAIDAAAPGGTVLMFTPLEPETPFVFNQSAAYFRDLSLVASYSCGPADTREALALLETRSIVPETLGVERRPFTAVAAAYDDLRSGRAIKPVVVF
ncbi:MAG: alcohol dehydrogenase catalytic domain-containing protein [Candidatus Velthaea sp.]